MHHASYGGCVWSLLCSAILHSRTDSLRSHVSLHGAVDPSSLCILGISPLLSRLTVLACESAWCSGSQLTVLSGEMSKGRKQTAAATTPHLFERGAPHTTPTNPKYCNQTDIPPHLKKLDGPSPQPCAAAKDHPLSPLNWTLPSAPSACADEGWHIVRAAHARRDHCPPSTWYSLLFLQRSKNATVALWNN